MDNAGNMRLGSRELQTGRDRFSVIGGDRENNLSHGSLQIWSNLNQASTLKEVAGESGQGCPFAEDRDIHPPSRYAITGGVHLHLGCCDETDNFIQPSALPTIHVGSDDTSRGNPENIIFDKDVISYRILCTKSCWAYSNTYLFTTAGAGIWTMCVGEVSQIPNILWFSLLLVTPHKLQASIPPLWYSIMFTAHFVSAG